MFTTSCLEIDLNSYVNKQTKPKKNTNSQTLYFKHTFKKYKSNIFTT